jgi:UDPglucose--hexose-1-phosphate uridylyltransferase
VTVSEYRRDPVTGRWVVIGTEPPRPADFHRESVRQAPDPQCPLCEGHEAMTPPELWVDRAAGAPNGPGWRTRVIPNDAPMVRVETALERLGEGVFDKIAGVGAHEVVVESPHHDVTLAGLDDDGITRVLWALRERIQDLRRDTRFRQFLIFKNHGSPAGAMLAHSHTQLLALPVVPREIQTEMDGAQAHHLAKERCLFCDIVRQEEQDGRRVILQSPDMVALAPFASRSPFETWILPRTHAGWFEEASLEQCRSLAVVLGDVLRRLDRALEQPPCSLVIHTAPVGEGRDFYHWHLEILPRVTRTGSLEWATGFHLNPTRPEDAAQFLRQLAAC